MKKFRKSTYLPVLLFIMGSSFYIYYGITQNSWRANLPNMGIYLIIIIALYLSLRQKEKLQEKREKEFEEYKNKKMEEK
jgi:c-di-AMP phosphodiesterase-like protein